MIFANTLEMIVHPVLVLRSARSGSQTACSARTTHRGHPMWRLVHQPSSIQLHQTIQLHALFLEPVTSVVKQATILVSVPRTRSRIRMLHPVPEATTTMVVASHPRRSTTPSPLLPLLEDVGTRLPPKRLTTSLTSFLVRSQSIMFLLPFFSTQEHLIHSCRKVMHFVMSYPLLNCLPQ